MNVIKFQKDSTLQRIKASYIEKDFQLTPHEEELKKRLLHFHSLRMDKKYSRHQAVKIHCREMGVSKATAYRDAQQAEFIMGDINSVDVLFERAMLMEAYWNLYQMNLNKGDLDKARSALDSYKSLINWNAEESKINPEKLAASDITVKFNRSAKRLINQYLSAGVLDMNNVDISDIDFKEIPPQSDEKPN